jgi:predicted dehydrogenase
VNHTSAERVIGVAQLGVGRWGVNLLRVLGQNPDIAFRAVCDLDPKLAAAAARRVNATPSSDYDSVLNDPTIDAVVISTPSGLHFQHVMAAIEAGKHVFVEKPMANSIDEAHRMIAAAESHKVRLMVGHTFLYNAAVREVKRLIDAGEIGDIHYVYSRRLNLGQFRRDSDVVWTLAPHDISIINHWLDAMPFQTSARGLTYVYPQLGMPEVCFSQLDYPGNRSAHLHLSWIDPQKCREMVVIGSKKMIVYDDTRSDWIIQIYDKRVETIYNDPAQDLTDFRSRLRAGDVVIPNIQMTEPLEAEIREFVACIREDRPALTDGKHGLEVVAVMEAMSQSLARNGAIVPVGSFAQAAA